MNYKQITKLQKECGDWYLQDLINSGAAWGLEGSIGRAAMSALDSGACMLPKKSYRDYYGNRMPSRDDLKKGTKGTFQNSVKYWENYN